MPRLTPEQEYARVKALFEFDEQVALEKAGRKDAIILGIDEVGRGPVAGPVAAGGVVWNGFEFIEFLIDSKKLTEKRREQVCLEVKQKSLFSCVEFVSAGEIDEIGIVSALRKVFLAVVQNCEAQGIVPDVILIDGNPIHIDQRETTIVKGDAKSAAISAASVLAKVTRDHKMVQLDTEFPQYEWKKNKGYGTKAHTNAIKEFGLTSQHRRSFLKNYL